MARRSRRGRTIGTPTRVLTMGVTRKFKRQRRTFRAANQKLVPKQFS